MKTTLTGVKYDTRRLLAVLAPFFRAQKARLLAGFGALIVVDFLQLAVPRFIKDAVDALGEGRATPPSLLKTGLAIIAIALAIALFRFCWRYLLLGFSRSLETDIRNWLFRHLLSLDRLFFHGRTTGSLMALATNDLAAVQMAAGMGLVACTDALVMTVAAIVFMVMIHPGLTLIALLPMPILALVTRFLSARLHERFGKVQALFSDMTEFVRSSIASIPLLKAYTQEDRHVNRFDRLGRRYISENFRLAMIQGALFPFSGLAANTSLLLVLYFGGSLTIRQVISIGDFVAFIAYLFMLTWPMMALGWVVNLFQRGATSLGRILEVLEERPALVGAATASPHLSSSPAGIVVRNLNFSYPGQLQQVLEAISFEFRPGLQGIVGRTGSGKTTLCHLLARLYPVPDRTICIDGIDVNAIPVSACRQHIAYVPQDVTLFSDTVAANLLMGLPAANQAEVEAAAKAAAIHDEIMALPERYRTRIGERGVKLSGGQRQRLALARALLSNRPVLIIDDGLSAVDLDTEHRIVGSLAQFNDRICIIVSHRLAPLVNAGRILVLEQGRVAAVGSHAQLLEENEYYRLMHALQQAAIA